MSCSACHFVPTGGGLLTPYGLGVQGAMSAFPTEVMPVGQRIYQGADVRAIELNKEYGGGFRVESLLNNSNSIGWEGLYGNTAAISRTSVGTFFRLSEDHWNGFMGEYLFTHFNEHFGGYSFNQQDVYVQPYIAIPEWIQTGFVYEFLAVTSPFYQNSFQYGPEVNLRVNRFVSLLGDGRNLGISGTTNWSWYGQVFLHVEI